MSSSVVKDPLQRIYPRDISRIAIQLRDCRLLWPGRFAFDFNWTAPPDLQLPATMTLSLIRDVADVSTSTTMDATLAASGAFTVELNTDPASEPSTPNPANSSPNDAMRWTGDRSYLAQQSSGRCSVQVQSDHPVDITNQSRGVRTDFVRPLVHAKDGTVDALLRDFNPANAEDPLVPLFALRRFRTRPPIDRLWISPADPMSSMTVSQRASCVTVTTTYGADQLDPRQTSQRTAPPSSLLSARITQQRGCPGSDVVAGPVSDSETVVQIKDDVWQVRVSGRGDASADLISRLSVLPFDYESPAATGFDGNAYLDAWYAQHPNQFEMGRAPWQGGQIGLTLGGSTAARGPVVSVDTVLAIPGEPMNSGQGGTNCRDSAIVTAANSVRGFVAVVTTDRITRAEYFDDDKAVVAVDLPLQVAKKPGYRFGLLGNPRLPGQPNQAASLRVRFFDANGSEVPCEQ